MRRVAWLVCMLFVVGVVLSNIAPVLAGDKTHEVKAQVVSADLEGKKLTIKDDTGANKTVPVMGKAIESLKNVKAGDWVILTCMDNEKGEHQGVTDIKMAPPAAK